LFDLLITSPNSFIAITPQWAYDIIQEFVYQFQSFSQYRSQHRDSSGEDGRLLEENQTAWSLPAVTFLLSRAVGLTTTYAPSGSIHYLIGYFSIIELSRVECLVCDYSASYETVSALIQPATSGASSGTPALYTTVFQSYLNLFYHTGISLIMLHRYSEAIELYSTIALHMARLQKPSGAGGNNANSKSSPYNQYQKIGDKILSLTALAAALSPSTPLDDHVADLMANKLGDKFRRLKTGNDVNVYREIFDSSVPKFVSSSTSVTSNDLRHAQTELFLTEVKQELDLLTTRNYLRLYTTIPISKLANFTNSTEEQTLLRLQALANKCQQEQQSAADGASVLKFSIQGTEVIVENGGKKKGITAQGVERYFTNGIRKNAELSAETEKIFRKLDA
jgi:translation initiation factor 3 subunit L